MDSASFESLRGVLFHYRSSPALQAFESGCVGSSHVVIGLGGLGDGLMPCSYYPALSAQLEARGFALVQPLLQSSFAQFGTGGLDRDAQDLAALMEHLRARRSMRSVSFVGHSTGCQILAYFFRLHAQEWVREATGVVCLQAPVSDREALGLALSQEEISRIMIKAKGLVDAGDGSEIAYFSWGAPVCAQRFVDLFSIKGKDDMFSSDLGNDYLEEVLGHLGAFKTLVCISLSDEYVPAGLYPELGERIAAAIPNSTLLACPDADHGLKSPESTELFVNTFVGLLPAETSQGTGQS